MSEITEAHHILKAQRARGEDWINSPLNLVILKRSTHGNMHTGSTNGNGKEERQRIYKLLWTNLLDWNQCENLFDSTELAAIRDMYQYCTIGVWRKEFRPDARTFAVYRLCCEKVQEYYGDNTPLHREI